MAIPRTPSSLAVRFSSPLTAGSPGGLLTNTATGRLDGVLRANGLATPREFRGIF